MFDSIYRERHIKIVNSSLITLYQLISDGLPAPSLRGRAGGEATYPYLSFVISSRLLPLVFGQPITPMMREARRRAIMQ